MISNDLLKRTPVRLAGAFAILFALTVVALVAVLYLTLVSELRSDIRQRVERDERHAACHRCAAGLRRSRRRRRRGSQVGARLRQHLPIAQRRRLLPRRQRTERAPVFTAGASSTARGCRWSPTRAIPTTASSPRGRRSPRGICSSATATAQIREVQRILLHGLGWALIATMLLATGSAIYLARRAQQKIDVFATTLSKVSRGEISERVPVSAIARRSRSRRGADQRHARASAEADRERQSGVVRHRARLEEAASADCAAASSWRCATPTMERRSAHRWRSRSKSSIPSSRRSRRCCASRRSRPARAARASAASSSGTVLADVADIYEPVAEEAGDRLVSTVAIAERAQVTGDRELLTQLFANLIENAIRHSPDGHAHRRRLCRRAATVTSPSSPTAGPVFR